MLLKDLKEIIKEAYETEETPNPNGKQAPDEKDKTVRAEKDVEAVKKSSDGVGEEAYNISTQLARDLNASLTSKFNVKEVKTDNNAIDITFDSTEVKMKHNGMTVDGKIAIAHIQSLVMAALGEDGNDVELKSEMLPGLLSITVKYINKA